jgi:Winged helix-turn-helix DNA-binding
MDEPTGTPHGSGARTSAARHRAALQDLGEAGAQLEALLTVLVSNCKQACKELDDGLSAIDSVHSLSDEAARTFRRDLHAATIRFEQAMQSSRGQSLSILVRDGGISVTELARRVGLSTQMVRRLMRIAEDA